MNGALLALTVAVSGGVGAAIRLVVDAELGRRWPRELATGTFVINIAGSLLAGVIVGCVLAHRLDSTVRTVVVTGFCGGLTTWSTAAFETVRLLESKRWFLSLLFGVGGFLASFAAAAAGLALVGA